MFACKTKMKSEQAEIGVRCPFACGYDAPLAETYNFGVVGGWLLQKSQIIEVFLFGKNSVNSGKLRNANPAVENRARRMFSTAENKKLQIPL